MRAVMLEVPWHLIEERRLLDIDRWDEMWDGELHMVPPPHGTHGRINDLLGVFFHLHWEALGLGRTYPETGVKPPGTPDDPVLKAPRDYRTPDRSFLLPERYDRLQHGWIVGGPDVVLEIASPGDESRAKLPFYAAVGVRETVIIDRETRAVEVLRSTGAGWAQVAPDAQGWVRSNVLRTEWRTDGSTLLVRRWDEPTRTLAIGD
jgi:Uma2 family endonuclease